MAQMTVPVRYYKDFPGGYDYGYEELSLPLSECAFLVVDVDGGYSFQGKDAVHPTTEKFIAPALAAARKVGMKVAYVHNDLRLVADPGNMAGEFWSKTKHAKGDHLESWTKSRDFKPVYADCVAPREGEPNFPKWMWSGFRDTFLDQRLRCWGTKTLFVVGYSRRACLHYTCAEAVGHNYRVILLRDCSNPPGEIEMPDTLDDSLPEGGWVNRMMLRQFEHLIGYTTTAAEFMETCKNLEGAA
ncbi:MAG: cysteine hydrolase [bacterium]|nr:cysteine hydrolase [bacterium]